MLCRPVIFCVVLVAAAYGQNAQVAAPDQTLSPGQTVIASLTLASSGQSIAAIQFDLRWDPALRLRPAAGEKMRSASKMPYVAAVDSQTLRCLIVGMDQTSLGDGELLRIFLSADPNISTVSATQVRITNVIASDPWGMAIPVDSLPINIQIQSGTPAQNLPAAAVLNAASLFPAPLSPGEIITLFGLTEPSSISLRIDGFPTPVLYAGADQINAIVPFGLDLSSAATLEMSTVNRKTALTLPVAAASPGIFTTDGTGLGPGAILNEDYTPNSFDNPARSESVIMVYGTGFGTMQMPVSDGQTLTAVNPTAALVTATVAGLSSEVLYAGAAPGFVAGVMQINIRLPAGLVHNSIAALALNVAGFGTLSGVTVAIQ